MSAYVGRNQQLDSYKEAVREEVRSQLSADHQMLEGEIELQLYFWRVRSAYTTPQGKSHRKHEADLTNMQKATEDALQGILFKNDKDVSHVESYIVEQGEGTNPCVVIGVRLFEPLEVPDAVWQLRDEVDKAQLALPFDDDSATWKPPVEGEAF